jgi:hypothetical protein
MEETERAFITTLGAWRVIVDVACRSPELRTRVLVVRAVV